MKGCEMRRQHTLVKINLITAIVNIFLTSGVIVGM